jgi:hypothetical protein
MKKLLAILVIVMLAVPMFAGTDILNFMWFNNKIGFAISDRYNLASANALSMGTNATRSNANSTGNGLNHYNFIEQFMCGMWGTAYDGDPIKLKMDFFNYFSCEMGDWTSLTNSALQLNEQIRFKGIMEVGSIYALAVGGKGFTRIYPLTSSVSGSVTDGTAGSTLSESSIPEWGFMGISLLLENTIKVPNIMNIFVNFEFMWVQWADVCAWARDKHGDQNHTELFIFMSAGLNGSYSFGFSWSLTQDVILGFNLENIAGNDPAVDGTVLKSGPQPAYFSNVPFFATTLSISQDILSLAGVKDVSLKVSADEKLLIQCPYSGGIEETKLINTQGMYGLTVGFYGFSLGAFMTLATQDSYNTDVPMNGYAGSTGNVGAAGGRNPGRGQAGVMIKFGYSRGFFGFDFAYHGQGQIRDYDYEKDNFASVLNTGSGLTVDNGGLFRIDTMYYRWSNMLSCSINFSW